MDGVMSWLAEKQLVAASDDYVKDFEHLLVKLFSVICIHTYVCT